MSEVWNYSSGRRLLEVSPLRSWYFLTVTANLFGAIFLTAYIIGRHAQTLGMNAIVVIAVSIGLQSFYQWWRAMRYYSRMRALYESSKSEPTKESSLDVALRIAAEGISDLLFYQTLMVLLCLVIVDFLLFRLDGLK